MVVFLKALILGLGIALRRFKLVVWLFAINTLLAVALTIPMWHAIEADFAHSANAKGLIQQHDRETIQDFLDGQSHLVGTFLTSAGIAAFAYYTLGIVLLGGILTLLAERGTRTSARSFGAGCGRYLGTFFRAEVVFAIAFFGLWLVNYGLSWSVRSLFNDVQDYATRSTWLGWTLAAKSALSLFLFALVFQAVSYAKIRAVLLDERSMVRGFFRGLALVLRHPISTNGFLIAITGLLISLYFGYAWVRTRIPEGSVDLFGFGNLPSEWAYVALCATTILVAHVLSVAKHAGQILVFRELVIRARPPESDDMAPLDDDHDLEADWPESEIAGARP